MDKQDRETELDQVKTKLALIQQSAQPTILGQGQTQHNKPNPLIDYQLVASTSQFT